MKHRKSIFFVPLIVAVVIIWVFNASYIKRIQKYSSDAEAVSVSSILSSDSISSEHFEFRPLKHDPFNIVPDTIPEEPIMPALALKGIVMTGDGALVLIQLPDGNVRPMKRGDEYLGVIIKKIAPEEVTVVFNGKTHLYSVLP
jgi:hypothetical protein